MTLRDSNHTPANIISAPSSQPKNNHGLYIHLPFCETKCGYCDFFSVPLQGQPAGQLVRSVVQDLDRTLAEHQVPLDTVFIGGGTPTVLPEEDFTWLFQAIADRLQDYAIAEFSVEANPATLTDEKAAVLVRAGVNRISFGVQSFNPDELAFLERIHKPEDVPEAVAIARRAGFQNLNLDLIFGVGGQTLDSWRDSLERALALSPEHLALYGLTYEPGTRLTAQLKRGEIDPCDEGIEAEMYLFAIDRLADAGFQQYEISNFARPGRKCLHNLTYWDNGGYLGVGPSAAGHTNGYRWRNVRSVDAYIQRVEAGRSPAAETEHTTPLQQAIELLMMRLRRIEGIDLESFRARTRVDLVKQLGLTLDQLVSGGLICVSSGTLSLTRRGLLFADSVLAELAANLDGDHGTALPVIQTRK